MTPKAIFTWGAVFGASVAGLAIAWLLGAAHARPASYAERPPERFLRPVEAHLVIMPSLEALDAECRSHGFEIARGRTFVECVIPDAPMATVLLPPMFHSPGVMGDALIHALGHVAGWSGGHDN